MGASRNPWTNNAAHGRWSLAIKSLQHDLRWLCREGLHHNNVTWARPAALLFVAQISIPSTRRCISCLGMKGRELHKLIWTDRHYRLLEFCALHVNSLYQNEYFFGITYPTHKTPCQSTPARPKLRLVSLLPAFPLGNTWVGSFPMQGSGCSVERMWCRRVDVYEGWNLVEIQSHDIHEILK